MSEPVLAVNARFRCVERQCAFAAGTIGELLEHLERGHGFAVRACATCAAAPAGA